MAKQANTKPTFTKIGQTVAEIWRFNGFQNGDRLPSWIFEIQIFWFDAVQSVRRFTHALRYARSHTTPTCSAIWPLTLAAAAAITVVIDPEPCCCSTRLQQLATSAVGVVAPVYWWLANNTGSMTRWWPVPLSSSFQLADRAWKSEQWNRSRRVHLNIAVKTDGARRL